MELKFSFIAIAMSTVNILSFIVGTSLTWSSPELPKLNSTSTTVFSEVPDSDVQSWIGSLLALGAIFSPPISGYLAGTIGRKWTILILAVPFLIAFNMLAFGTDYIVFYIARFLCGLSVGGVFTVTPMYIGEIATNENRGALGSVFSVFITMGLLFSYAVGPYLSIQVFNIILAVLPLIFIVLFFLICPESPHYLLKKGKYEEAENVFRRIRGTKDVKEELESTRAFLEESGEGTFFDIFKSKALTKAFIIGMCLITFQQLSGINVVLFYAQDIFKATGSTLSSEIPPIIIGVVQVLATCVTPLAADRLGRKLLLLISAVGMTIAEIPLGVYFYLQHNGNDVDGISWLPVLCLILYIITYNLGFGAIVWAMMGELFPSNVKSASNTSVSMCCWVFGFIITKFFAQISDHIGKGPSFWIFSACCVLAGIFTQLFVIETKGKSLQEIQNMLGK